MGSPKDRLAHLLALAAEPGARHELVRELAELLTDWPADYPLEARASFAALLARTEHDVDPETRRALAVKLSACADAPLALLNEFFFDVPQDSRTAILARDALTNTDAASNGVSADALIGAARSGADIASAFATVFGIDTLTASEILQDSSGMGIAIACRGARAARAAYSTLVVLLARGDIAARLALFDTVPENGAAAMLAFWRKQADAHASQPQAA